MGERAALLVAVRDRQPDLLDEAAHALAHRLQFLGQREIHGGPPLHDETMLGRPGVPVEGERGGKGWAPPR